MHDVTNTASRRVVDKCGFVYEGTMRRVVADVAPEIRAGGYLATGDARMYGMLVEDFERQPWVAGVRAATTLVDVFGGETRLV